MALLLALSFAVPAASAPAPTLVKDAEGLITPVADPDAGDTILEVLLGDDDVGAVGVIAGFAGTAFGLPGNTGGGPPLLEAGVLEAAAAGRGMSFRAREGRWFLIPVTSIFLPARRSTISPPESVSY